MTGKVLQRYTLRELASPTILGLIVFTFILLSTHLFRLIDLLVNRGVPLRLFGALVGTLLPPLLILTAPMALLVGVLLGVGRLAADNEIMAMRTSGVHLMRVFTPVVVTAVLLSGGLYVANREFVPRLVNLNEVLLKQIQFIVASHLEPGRRFEMQGERDIGLYFKQRKGHRMEGITLKVQVSNPAEQGAKSYFYASAMEGDIDPNPFAGYMDITLTSGTLHHLDSATTGTDFRNVVTKFGELVWRMEMQEEYIDPADNPQALTNSQIVDAVAGGQVKSKDIGTLKAELYQRRSIPLACVAFVLLGVPMAIRVRPTGKAVAFSIAFGLIFFYYIMLKWGVSLCQESSGGSPLGALIIFLPNILVGGMGILLFFKIMRQ